METILSLLLITTFSTNVFAQNTSKAIIKNEKTNEPLIGASIFLKATQNGTITNDRGFAELRNIPTGRQTIIIKSFGFKENKENILFPQNDTIPIFLETAC